MKFRHFRKPPANPTLPLRSDLNKVFSRRYLRAGESLANGAKTFENEPRVFPDREKNIWKKWNKEKKRLQVSGERKLSHAYGKLRLGIFPSTFNFFPTATERGRNYKSWPCLCRQLWDIALLISIRHYAI